MEAIREILGDNLHSGYKAKIVAIQKIIDSDNFLEIIRKWRENIKKGMSKKRPRK